MMARTVEKSNQSRVLNSIRDEHRHLAVLFKRVHGTIAKAGSDTAPVAGLFAELLDSIEQHFAHEEEGGYYDDLVEMAPRLESTVNSLRAQHTTMLNDLKTIHRLAQRREGSAKWWRVIEVEFNAFVRQCGEHESHENRLVQEAYTQDLGTQD